MAMPGLELCEKEVCIFTLGKFYIRQNDKILSESTARSKRMWEVFKFLLSHRGKAFLPETILERINPGNDYPDPGQIIRALVYRLRQVLSGVEQGFDLGANITAVQGGYAWEDRNKYSLDVDIFSSLFARAQELEQADQPAQAAESYRQAIALYQGQYLPELSFSEWVEPLRAHYHDLYLDSVLKLAALYKRQRNHQEIIKLCDQALTIDYYEEIIHIRLLEALIADGNLTRARAHYNEVTSIYYRELGVKPSEQLKNLYRLFGVEQGGFELDLSVIQERLKGKDQAHGAYLCDRELFRYFYQLERNRLERSGKSVLLCLLTLTTAEFRNPDQQVLRVVMDNLEVVILDSLRKGDLVTRWNQAQFLMLLGGLNREQADMVLRRIEDNYAKVYSLQGLSLHKRIENMIPLEEDASFF